MSDRKLLEAWDGDVARACFHPVEARVPMFDHRAHPILRTDSPHIHVGWQCCACNHVQRFEDTTDHE
jgi:hypothetical protein